MNPNIFMDWILISLSLNTTYAVLRSTKWAGELSSSPLHPVIDPMLIYNAVLALLHTSSLVHSAEIW